MSSNAKPASLQLAEEILKLFDRRKATSIERFVALDVSRALVPVTAIWADEKSLH